MALRVMTEWKWGEGMMGREDQVKSRSSVHGTIFPLGLGTVLLLRLLLHKHIADAITTLQPKGIFAPAPVFPKQKFRSRWG